MKLHQNGFPTLVVAGLLVTGVSVVIAARLRPRKLVNGNPQPVARLTTSAGYADRITAAAERFPNVSYNKDTAVQAPSSIKVETVTLSPGGFEPKEINRSAGKFVLGVDNRIRTEQLSFELLRDDGHRAHQVRIIKGQIRFRKLLNLPPGRYSLRVVDHPEWTCRIVLSN